MPLTQVSSRAIEDTLRYVLGASGTNHYTFTGKGLTGAVNDPTLTLSRGHTYIFENRSGGHPFYIKTSIANGGTNDAYNTGVTNNGGCNGTEIVFTVPHDAPDTLYYQCSSHSSMAGQLSISGSVADGSITESKLADDAVTADKLANSINSAIAANSAKTSLEDESVTLAKFEHGTSSNDGKFLRANNGADPSFETIDLTSLSASNLTSGTVPDARFPATLPAASAANLTSIPAANLTGALPAISGASLTGLSSGLAMADQWRITSTQSNVYGNAHITANWERNDKYFAQIGTGMTQSNGYFTFPATGIYLIRAIGTYEGQNDVHGQNERQYLGLLLYATQDDSSYSTLAEVYDSSGNKYGHASRACVVSEAIFDVTNVTTHKIKLHHHTVGSAYLRGDSNSQHTGITFIKLGDT